VLDLFHMKTATANHSRKSRKRSPPATATGAPSDILRRLDLIFQSYHAGILGPTVHEVFPDTDRSSRAWRLYFTLPCAINYQRKSENLWSAALSTFDDSYTRFVFDCANVTKGVDAYKVALTKHRLALQTDRHTHIWFTISETLNRHFDGDPLNVFKEHDFDASNVKEYVAGHKRLFPYISGPKLLNYWIYIFSSFTDVPLKRKEEISVIPDTHVKRATVALGLMTEEAAQDTNRVAEFWCNLLSGTRYAPSDLHAPLWRWSRAGLPADETLGERLQQQSCHRTAEQ
jgi:hypothetical protein